MSLAQRTIIDLAVSLPAANTLFQQLGLSLYRDGENTLAEVIQHKGPAAEKIMEKLTALQHEAQSKGLDPNLEPYGELIAHILQRYHQCHRQQLAELIVLAEKVEQVHREHDACPVGLTEALRAVEHDLGRHMMKEEQILFPMIRAGQYAMAAMPIRVMEHEHDEHGSHIQTLYDMTADFTPPADACSSWRTLYAGIKTFVEDLSMHIHTENNILFKRVVNEGR
ncbi:regulator of cell morphogenesis and NO signaling [Mesocricetibacter intestinalis]|uniref:Regulator of cell morphogenesis and NO signaling n=1 Tax=Mesocricetibacter intestinalis TaxID=1521930 RepID=A0A4R6VB25_9PAST|nr:iron-sulfur cluster repair protein YtfE [Mesocricetibacter intestinalis]TDQ57623.1 regulator of cell morphogenesis and NO signaling [Mesocricetibacter intestinalis]